MFKKLGQKIGKLLRYKKGHWCCLLLCPRQADWEIWYGNTPDDYTHACTKHVGRLLETDVENRVHWIRGV